MKLFAKKSLGQHFLTSRHVLDEIIRAANIHKDETILEIGPGLGVLTRELLGAGAHVIAVEKDDRAVEALREMEGGSEGRLKIFCGDILEMDPTTMLGGEEEYAIVANIPYYITGAILSKFLENSPRPSRMILLIQKEVADRIVARDGKESILSVSVKAFGKPMIIAKVPPGAFNPPPSVDSAILAIEKISDQEFRTRSLGIRPFFDIVRAGFAHKRKLLARNLEAVLPTEIIQKTWISLGFEQKVRAEDLTVENWFDLAEKTAKNMS